MGRPDDHAVADANRRHEDHHAADHHAVFRQVVRRWDRRLTAAHTAGTTYHGASAAAAEAALWAAMGGIPDEIADRYWNRCLARGGAYHRTAAGGPIRPAAKAPGSSRNCSRSWAYYVNPA